MSLSADDKTQLGDAIAAAERATRAQIVLAVTEACDDYAAYPLLWAAAIGFVTTGALALIWPAMHLRFAFLCTGAVVLVAAILLHWPRLRGALVPAHVKHEHAQRMAKLHFAGHVAGRTADSIGLLIFVAVAEHYIEIVPDTGIAARIPAATWTAIVAEAVPHIGRGGLTEGLEKVIAAGAKTLAQPFPRGADDRNEIPDAVVYTPR